MNRESLRNLIFGYLDERLSDEEFTQLQELVESDATAREEYLKFARLDSGLRDMGSSEDPLDRLQISRLSAIEKSPKFFLLIIGAMAALVIAAMFFSVSDRGEPIEFATSDSSPRETLGVAVISAQADAVWAADSRRLGKGEALAPGRIQLREGLVQIDFFGGASVSLLGPADIELVSKGEAILHRGHLKADVPPAARGFKIHSGDVLIEDLGTSFGLAVRENSGADIVVFDGEVTASGSDGTKVSLFGGQSASLESGQVSTQSIDEKALFPDIKEVFAGAEDQDQFQYLLWKETSISLSKDPRLIAYYDFENLTAVSRRLRNRATSGSGAELDGGIVGARVAGGRWPGKTSLDFRREGDRVRFDIPGEFEELTLFAWVRIDALDRHLNSLFLTDYYDPGEFHWQISSKGALHFATSPKGVEDLEKNNRRFYSEPFWTPQNSGQWFFLATTVDKLNGVTHFINGKAVGFSGGTNREKPLPVMRIGKADLGNWSEPIWPKVAMRTLNGRIDEFALFKEALSEAEIETIYHSGKP